jgi:hypothetical protein
MTPEAGHARLSQARNDFTGSSNLKTYPRTASCTITAGVPHQPNATSGQTNATPKVHPQVKMLGSHDRQYLSKSVIAPNERLLLGDTGGIQAESRQS